MTSERHTDQTQANGIQRIIAIIMLFFLIKTIQAYNVARFKFMASYVIWVFTLIFNLCLLSHSFLFLPTMVTSKLFYYLEST